MSPWSSLNSVALRDPNLQKLGLCEIRRLILRLNIDSNLGKTLKSGFESVFPMLGPLGPRVRGRPHLPPRAQHTLARLINQPGKIRLDLCGLTLG